MGLETGNIVGCAFAQIAKGAGRFFHPDVLGVLCGEISSSDSDFQILLREHLSIRLGLTSELG